MIGAVRKSHTVAPAPLRIQSLLAGVDAAVRAGQLAHALRLADAACRFAPGQASVANVKAAVLARLGSHAEALALIPDDVALSLQATHLRLLADAGHAERARSHAKRLLRTQAVDTVDGLAVVLDDWCRQGLIAGWDGFDSRLVPQGSVPGPAAGRLGVTLAAQIDFGGQGWVWRQGQHLRGEVRLRWAPRLPLWLLLRDARGEEVDRLLVAPSADGLSPAPFELALPPGLHGQACQVALACPDGRLHPLIGSPAAEPGPRPTGQPATSRADTRIDIVIPVYADRDATLACLHSVLETVDAQRADILVVNDASPDAGLVQALHELATRRPGLSVVDHADNQGYSASVNRGIAWHPWRDVVLLNADCVVHGDWLERLLQAADTAPDIGSVTPLGQGSITSYPLSPAPPQATPDAAALDQAAAAGMAGQVVEIPVAVGFCVLLRRAMLAAVGSFDAQRFLRGYGEENDLCLRARDAGWRHVATPGVYVAHRGGSSFGAERTLWMRRNQQVLLDLHPQHDRLVEHFLGSDPLHAARRTLDLAQVRQRMQAAPGPRTLFVSLGLRGGVLRRVEQTQAGLRAQGGECLLLRPDPDFEPGACSHRLYLGLAPLALHDLYFDWPAEREPLLAALRGLDLGELALHHFLGLPAALVDDLLALLPRPRITLHDHAWLCPRISLSDGSGRYCGEPDLAGCERCIARHGSELEPGLGAGALRQRSARWLAQAARIVAPTQDTRRRYLRHFPGLAIDAVPWEDTPAAPAVRAPRAAGDLRVAVIGAISRQKGYDVLLACAREAATRQLPIQFVLIGYSEDDAPLLDTGRVFVTGPYAETELDALVRREACDVAWIASLAPETWCYALTPALRQGLPVMGYALGAVQERLEGHPAARCLPLETPVRELLETLFELGPTTDAWRAPASASMSSLPSTALPSVQPSAAADQPSAATGPWVHPASVQTLLLPEGTYGFSVPGGRPGESFDASQVLARHQLRLPAMQIGPAPTPQATQVELFPAPGTLDRWLSRAGDQLTVRVHGGEVAMLLTSVRRQSDQPLHINVVRLDQPQPVTTPGQAPLRVLLHVQLLGDLFYSQGLAGPVHHGLAVEAFVVDCKDPDLGNIVEYRSQTADGFETPWLSDGMLCGSRGRGVHLLAFSVRLRVKAAHRGAVACRGYFRKAGWVLADASQEWCRSPLPDDPLEGMDLQLAEPA